MRTISRGLAGPAALVFLIVADATPAYGQAAEVRQTATAVFDARTASKPTGLSIAIDYVNPADPAAKPPAVRTIELTLARGARVDSTALPVCQASDQELMAVGPSACSESVVGGGSLILDTGFPEPGRYLENGITLLNGGDDLTFLFDQGPGRLATHAPITNGGRTITASAPFLPGTPPDGAAVDEVIERIERIANGYVTTPRRCSCRGYWINRWAFTYADGVTQRVAARSPCRRSARRQ